MKEIMKKNWQMGLGWLVCVCVIFLCCRESSIGSVANDIIYVVGALMMVIFCCYDLFKRQESTGGRVRKLVWSIKNILIAMVMSFGSFAFSKWVFNMPVSGEIWMLTVGLAVASMIDLVYLICAAGRFIKDCEELAPGIGRNRSKQMKCNISGTVALFIGVFLVAMSSCVIENYSYGTVGTIFAICFFLGLLFIICAAFIRVQEAA